MAHETPVEPLLSEDLRIIESMRRALGEGAAQRTRALILKERASHIVPVNKDQIQEALNYAHDMPGARVARGFWVVARKFITEDPGMTKRFEGYCQALLEGETGPSFDCKVCDPPTLWGSVGSLAVHKSKAHGIAGAFATARRRAKRRNKRVRR